MSASLPALPQRSEDDDTDNRGLIDRFRAVIFGARADVAPPEVPHPLDDGDVNQDNDLSAQREGYEPSAPPPQQEHAPPPYEAIHEHPIIRSNRGLANESFSGSGREEQEGGSASLAAARLGRSVEMREMSSAASPRPQPCMEEVLLSQSLR